MLLYALSLATVNQVFSLLDPQIFRLIVDRYASKALELTRSEFFSGILLLLGASMAVAFVSRVAKNFQDYFVSIITQKVGAGLYEDSIHHSFSLPYAAFEDQRSGELLQKLQKARTDSQQFITSFINVIFLSLVGIIFIITYAFSVNHLMGIVFLSIIPITGTLTFFLSKKIKSAQKEIVTQSASLAGSTTETLRNVELVKSLGLEDQEAERLNSSNEKILGLELKKIKLIRLLSFIQGSLINGIRSAILLLMMWLIFEKAITFGEFFSLYIYTFFIFGPLQELGNVFNQYQETTASMEKLQEVLNTKPELKPVNSFKIDNLDIIDFKNISFTYANKTDASVNGVNIIVKKGESIAFVGPSGAGKTTLAKLLVGLYKPSQGSMLINGNDSTKVDFDYFRKKIGYVSQDTQLFAGTIKENLLFVKPDATDAECLEVVRQASALGIIERGGKGLETKIGEGGIKISGGERQRLAIARALLRKPELIVFDEATSSLDSLTEKEITETIKHITSQSSNLMTVTIAHRLSTIAHADRIYVLEKGSVVEVGDHDQLLKLGGLYAALWREQGMTAERIVSLAGVI